MQEDVNNDIIFTPVMDEASLRCRHNDMPIYIPILKTTLTVGHYVTVRSPQGRCFVGQIIGRHIGGDYSHNDTIDILPYLPLFSGEFNDYFDENTILPRSITEAACRDVVEVFRTSSIATVRTTNITGIAFVFVFLAEQLTSFLFDVQGMRNAFVIRFKYCLSAKALIRLSNDSFYCFPDSCINYRQIWSECYARTIFNSIDHLRQEMWRFLCRYGQSQGLFPKQMLTLYFPTVFTTYISNYLIQFGIPSQECSLFEPQRRIELNFMYRVVTSEFLYRFFRIESEESIDCFTQMMGTMSIFGVRKKMPRKDAEVAIRNFDLVNAISRIDLYINLSKIKMRLFAFRHTVGDPTTCNRLLAQVGTAAAPEERIAEAIETRASSTLRLRSKFDYMGNVYEVLAEQPDGLIKCVCKWGSLSGTEELFNKRDVISMVNQKRG